MSNVTSIVLTMPHDDENDHRERFERAVQEHAGFRPEPTPDAGTKGSDLDVYHCAVNYITGDLLNALVAGPWPRGTVLCVQPEDRQQFVKVFGAPPASGWDSVERMEWREIRLPRTRRSALRPHLKRLFRRGRARH
jgi:hypothetical protein